MYSYRGIFWIFFFFFYEHYSTLRFICRPSVSTVSEDDGIEPRTVANLALAARCSNYSARFHPLIYVLLGSLLDFKQIPLFVKLMIGTKVLESCWVLLMDEINKNVPVYYKRCVDSICFINSSQDVGVCNKSYGL